MKYNPYSKISIRGSLVSMIPSQWGHCPNHQRKLSYFISQCNYSWGTATIEKATAGFIVHQEKIDDR